VRDFFVERYKKRGSRTIKKTGRLQLIKRRGGFGEVCRNQITPSLHQGFIGVIGGQIPQDFIGISTLRKLRTSAGHAVLGFAELHVRKRAV
jgi:hypothetical protein